VANARAVVFSIAVSAGYFEDVELLSQLDQALVLEHWYKYIGVKYSQDQFRDHSYRIVLHGHTAQRAACFNHIGAGRDGRVRGIHDAISPFFNLLLAKVSFGENDASLECFGRRIKTRCQGCRMRG
jgi:hypothetical protein